MKLSNLTILFIAIIFPVILLLSAYIEIQVDTLSLQTSYDTKLISATYDAISALEMNTSGNEHSTVSDSLRRDIKASISTFTTSLSSSLGVSGYGEKYIMPYVPALVFTLYDGYYIYTPYKVVDDYGNTSYDHTLKPYVYYSKKYSSNGNEIVICYSLDNYVTIYGTLSDGSSFSEAGYLITENKNIQNEKLDKYQVDDNGNISFIRGIDSTDAKEYYEKANEFTINKYNSKIEKLGSEYSYLKIDNSNDPELEDSPFTLEKRSVMKDLIVSNLNEAMENYTKHTKDPNKVFRLQEFSIEDWGKIYNNICMISFLEGFPVGTKTYNNYAVIASTKNEQYTNMDQIYYISENGKYYHKLGCTILDEEIRNGARTVTGYKNIDFDLKKKEISKSSTEKETIYYNEHNNVTGCYNCIIESNSEKLKYKDIKNDNSIKAQAYYRAIGRIRKGLNKASEYINIINN